MSGEPGSADRTRTRTVAVYPDWRENPYLEQLASGLRPHGYRLRFPAERWSAVPILSSLRSEEILDLVHLHWQHPYVHGSTRPRTAVKVLSLLVDMLGLRWLGVPVVWTVHNLVDHERSAPRLERTVGAVLARIVDRIVVHCSAARDAVAAAYRLTGRRREKIEVVPHPNYAGEYPPLPDRRSARRELGLGDDRYVYLHFGSIRPYKRLGFLTSRFREVAPENAMLLVAGRVVDHRLHASLAGRASSDERIRVDGRHVPREEVPVYFAAADAFVYAADGVLMSGAVMLALTYGLPILAPRTGCLPEVVPEEGVAWYEPGDEASLPEALAAVRSLPAGRARRANRRRAARYDPESVGRRLADVYDTVAGPP